jgi:hypothetical protein
MADLSGVAPSVPQPGVAPVNDVENADLTQATLPAGPGIDQLPKPLLDAIMYAMAQQSCQRTQRSTEKMKEILREEQDKR